MHRQTAPISGIGGIQHVKPGNQGIHLLFQFSDVGGRVGAFDGENFVNEFDDGFLMACNISGSPLGIKLRLYPKGRNQPEEAAFTIYRKWVAAGVQQEETDAKRDDAAWGEMGRN